MALIQIRRGLQKDLPKLNTGELGLTTDTKRLYVGNGDNIEFLNGEETKKLINEESSILREDVASVIDDAEKLIRNVENKNIETNQLLDKVHNDLAESINYIEKKSDTNLNALGVLIDSKISELHKSLNSVFGYGSKTDFNVKKLADIIRNFVNQKELKKALDTKADIDHAHNEYATEDELKQVKQKIKTLSTTSNKSYDVEKANLNHKHKISEVSGLQNVLNTIPSQGVSESIAIAYAVAL